MEEDEQGHTKGLVKKGERRMGEVREERKPRVETKGRKKGGANRNRGRKKEGKGGKKG